MNARARQAWTVLAAALIVQITVSVVTQGIPTLTPFLRQGLHLNHAAAGFLGTSIFIGGIVTAVMSGWAVDILGQRRILFVGGVATGLIVLVATRGDTFGWLVVLLALAGVAGSMPTVAGSKAVMSWFPHRQRAFAMSVRQTGIPIGGAIAAALLPPIALAHGWRVAIAVGALAAIGGAVVCALLFREESPPESESPVQPQPERGVPWDMLNGGILLLAAAGFLLVWGQFSLITYLPLYLNADWHIPFVTGSMFLIVAQGCAVPGRIFWGRASDRWFGGRRKAPLVLVTLIAAALTLTVGRLPQHTPAALIAVVVGAYGFVAIGWNGLYVTLSSELAGPERAGRAVGFTLMANQLGVVCGPVLFGHAVDVSHSYRLAWTLLSGVLLIGALLVAWIKEGPSMQTSGARAAPDTARD